MQDMQYELTHNCSWKTWKQGTILKSAAHTESQYQNRSQGYWTVVVDWIKLAQVTDFFECKNKIKVSCCRLSYYIFQMFLYRIFFAFK
jgi:hypothetical protein